MKHFDDISIPLLSNEATLESPFQNGDSPDASKGKVTFYADSRMNRKRVDRRQCKDRRKTIRFDSDRRSSEDRRKQSVRWNNGYEFSTQRTL